MNRMARMCFVLAALFALPLTSAAQKAPLRAGTYELSAQMITLPSTDPGFLSVTAGSCAGCMPLSVMTSNGTRYEIGDAPVTLAEIRKQFTLYPNALVLVVLEADLNQVKRVKMWSPAATER